MNEVNEWCPYCDTEVILSSTFEVQACPNCNHALMPCSICEHRKEEYYDDCANCPLKKIK